MSYSFVSPRKNLSNLRKYIFDNVLTLLDSFPLSIAAKIDVCDKSILDDFGSFNAFGTQLSTMDSFNSEEIFTSTLFFLVQLSPILHQHGYALDASEPTWKVGH